jgi:hypothetical protein
MKSIKSSINALFPFPLLIEANFSAVAVAAGRSVLHHAGGLSNENTEKMLFYYERHIKKSKLIDWSLIENEKVINNLLRYVRFWHGANFVVLQLYAKMKIMCFPPRCCGASRRCLGVMQSMIGKAAKKLSNSSFRKWL